MCVCVCLLRVHLCTIASSLLGYCRRGHIVSVFILQFTYETGKYIKLGEFKGDTLLGLPIRAPNAVYPVVYTLPLMTISMTKGTGVVTSVPSDAPDDYAALRDLQQKEKVRMCLRYYFEHYIWGL